MKRGTELAAGVPVAAVTETVPPVFEFDTLTERPVGTELPLKLAE